MKNFINEPLYKLERKSNYKSLIVFSVLIGALCFVICALYPTLKDITGQIPDEFKNLFIMGSLPELFQSQGYESWAFLTAIFSAYLAVRLTTKEFRDGSYEMLYTLNISRGEIARTKLLRLVINTIIANIVVFGFSLAGLLIWGYGQFNVLNLLLYYGISTLVSLQIGVICFAFGLLMKRKFGVISAIILVVSFFMLTSITIISPELEWVGCLSPITAVTGTIITEGFAGIALYGIALGIWSVLSALLLIVALSQFKKDDLS